VNISRKDYDHVLQTMHVVNYVTFEGKAAVIPGEQIQVLKELNSRFEVEVNVSDKNFIPGEKVEIIAGPLMGIKGELTGIRSKNRFVIRIDQINTAFSVELSSEMLSYFANS